MKNLFPHANPAYLNVLATFSASNWPPLRLEHFLAQWAAETDGFRLTEESGNYTAARLLAVFPRYFDAESAARYERRPMDILSRTYANRLGNGDEASRDGWKYRGRGWPQLTGFANYCLAGAAIGVDLASQPDLAADPRYVAAIALWEWNQHDLNEWADRDDVVAISKAINCGSPTSETTPNGLESRIAWLAKIKAALAGNVASVSPLTNEETMDSEPSTLEPASGKEPAWLTLARAELGTKEARGAEDNPAVVAYYKDAGHPEIRHDSVAWCAAYCSAMLERSGTPSAKTLSAREYMTWGKALAKPQTGCVAVFSRGDPRAYTGHVGFYLGEEDGKIKVLGGNQGDAVSVTLVAKSRLLGYRWPIGASNSRTFRSQAGVIAGVATTAVSGLAASSPELLAVSGEVKALSHLLPWAIFIGAAIAITAAVATIAARMKDLAEKGR